MDTSFRKQIHIIGGGTVNHVRAHLALAAVAYGATARTLAELCVAHPDCRLDVQVHLTRMADGGRGSLETNDDVEQLVRRLTSDPQTKVIFLTAALCDYRGQIAGEPSDRHASRLQTAQGEQTMTLTPTEKIVRLVRKERKDITLIACKTTCGATEDEQYKAGLHLLKTASCNLVLANDLRSRRNMIITPEEAHYAVTTHRQEALRELVDIALARSHLTFTRSTVVAGSSVSWESAEVPVTLRKVVNHLIARGAYQPFGGATVGHFACKVSPTEFLTSKRKTNFNDLAWHGLVRIVTDGPDSVIAYGSKPSVGGQSQRSIFGRFPEYDCIAHAHVVRRPGSRVPVVSQREYECGSHECGQNTAHGLAEFNGILAVYLDNHGPNIVFKREYDPGEVIRFIEDNFDLTQKIGGNIR